MGVATVVIQPLKKGRGPRRVTIKNSIPPTHTAWGRPKPSTVGYNFHEHVHTDSPQVTQETEWTEVSQLTIFTIFLSVIVFLN